MRLYSFRDPSGHGASEPIGVEVKVGTGLLLGLVGRLDDDLVEIGPDRHPIPVAELTPAPAVPRPGKIVCVGLNLPRAYRGAAHRAADTTASLREVRQRRARRRRADRPPGRDAGARYGAELRVVIGRQARPVRAQDAMGHVAGYIVVNDVTVRDWQGNKAALRPGQRGDGQWLRAKGSDTFLPMGPVLVTADEFDGPPDLRIRSWRIPGTGPDAGRPILMQDGRTGDLLFGIPSLIEFISAVITLDPGDVIATGTPAGVGVFRDPPVFLEPGDRARVEIEGIGSVDNPVVEAVDQEAKARSIEGGGDAAGQTHVH